jgi:hypothetical protein
MRDRVNRIGPFVLLALAPAVVWVTPPQNAVAGIVAIIGAVGMLLPLREVVIAPRLARAGSLVDDAARRRPWLIALAAALFHLTLRIGEPSAVLSVARLVVAGALTLIVALDVRALVRLGRGLVGSARLRPRTSSSPPVDDHTVVHDFGLGEEEEEELAPPAAVYRERERVVRLVRGSRQAATSALAQSIALAIAAALPTVFVFFAVVAEQARIR